MNFLNDSLKQLKTVLAEGLESQVIFDGGAKTELGSSGVSQPESIREHENLRKLCQHQSEEVNFTIVSVIALFFLFALRGKSKQREFSDKNLQLGG